ncbi:DUF397 domain-containing protein [Streptomyces sp. BSE7F]|nr:DUF397 domain-containing protein [Streptomyces sp. SMS_SU21]NEA92471.1 DUF397 domain-containing protein [Actinospica acidiphila]PWE11240.1 DUF397 domain-containing protein [Streptomyces sp. BSE7F]
MPAGVPLRDSKVPDGSAVLFSGIGRTAFVAALKE